MLASNGSPTWKGKKNKQNTTKSVVAKVLKKYVLNLQLRVCLTSNASAIEAGP